MTDLTLKEIKEAFPEGERITSAILKDVNSQINEISKQYEDIYFNDSYNEFTKEFIIICINQFHLRPLTEKRSRLLRYRAVYRGREYDNSNLTIAKEYPILDLFSPEKIKKTRDRSFCCCPIHGEKTASFCVYHNTNTFYCFGCHKGGDSVAFIQALHQMDFRDALKYMGGLV